MKSSTTRRAPIAVIAIVGLIGALTTIPALAAVTPLDVSGPVDGLGSGVAVTPSTGVVAGGAVTVTAENLPTAVEAAAWVDDGDFSDEVGTHTGPVNVSLCGNADSSGVILVSFDSALHCDGGDARSTTFVVAATATSGALSIAATTRDGFGQFDYDDDADPGTPTVLASAGIGSAEATCVPSATPCRYRIVDGAVSVFSGEATFVAVPPPSLALVSITGQLPGAAAARGGNDLVVSGADWDPASGLLVEFCDVNDELLCDPSSSSAGLAIDAGGLLTGTVPVSTLNSVGSRFLKITQSSNGARALMPVLILGARTITLDIASGGAGTPVNLTGTNFDPLQPVTVLGSDGVNPTSDTGAAVVDSTGNITGSIVVNSPATVSIVVTEDDNPTTEGASAPFSFTIQSQVGQVTVNGSGLLLTQAAGLVSMSAVTLSEGITQQSTGAIQTVTVDDSRGTLTGWSVTATATDWVDIAEPDPGNPTPNHVIPAGNLAWVPSCAPAPGSTADPADVVTGPAAGLDPSIAATLCSAAPGGGGGAWTADAGLFLNVPSSIAAATYQATLTIVAV